jgi:hypothetical protein
MTEQHIPVEELAAYAAGDLDATAAVAVEAHLVLCAECRSDVDAVTKAGAALATVEPVTMPAEVAARIDEALRAATPAPPTGTVLPMRRRRPSLSAIAAVAAGVALLGAVTVPMLRTARKDSAESASTALGGGAQKGLRTPRRLDSGLEYTHKNLAATLRRAAGGATAPKSARGAEQGAIAPSAPAGSSATPLTGFTSGDTARETSTEVLALKAEPGRFAACVDALASGLPAAARVPLLVDFARYEGKPAIVVAFQTVSRGAVVADRIDVWVAGPGCGTVPGGEVLDFARIPRPTTL